MKRRQSSSSSMGKDKVAVKDAGKSASKPIPGKKTEPDVTQARGKSGLSKTARKLENRQL